jgi:hypothetical protein
MTGWPREELEYRDPFPGHKEEGGGEFSRPACGALPVLVCPDAHTASVLSCDSDLTDLTLEPSLRQELEMSEQSQDECEGCGEPAKFMITVDGPSPCPLCSAPISLVHSSKWCSVDCYEDTAVGDGLDLKAKRLHCSEMDCDTCGHDKLMVSFKINVVKIGQAARRGGKASSGRA